MLVNRKFDIAAIVIIAAGLVAYSALQPRYRLPHEVPAEFLREVYSVPPQKREVEEKIARAYWKCAESQIQWEYGYGHRLPESPSAGFMIASQEFGAEATGSATRARYWRRLQNVWYVPSTWQKEYGWDLGWMKKSIVASGEWLQSQIDTLTGTP